MTAKTNHKPFIGLMLIFAILSTSFSLLLPLGESADEVSHFELVRFIVEQGHIPFTEAEREAIGKKGDASPIYHTIVAVLTQSVDVSSLPTLLPQSEPYRFVPYDAPRTNMIFHTDYEQFPYRGIVLAWHLGRLVSMPLGLLTLLGIYLTILLIYPHRPFFALAATSFAAFLPRFLINSGVINDDNLVIPLTTLAIYFLVRLIQGDERRTNLLLSGGFIGLAAIVKYHSLVLWLEVVLIFLVLGWRNHWTWRHLFNQAIWVMLGFVTTAGWWFVFLYSRFNQIAELGFIKGILVPLGDPVIASSFDILFKQPIYWIEWLEPLFQTFWIVYGSTQVFAPLIVYQTLVGLSFVVFIGLLDWLYKSLKTNLHWNAIRWDIALLLLHALIYLGIIVVRFQAQPTVVGAQGRHLFPALISIAFFVILGLSEYKFIPDQARDYERSPASI